MKKKEIENTEESKLKTKKVKPSKVKTEETKVSTDADGSAVVTKKHNPVAGAFKASATWFSHLNRWVKLAILVLLPIIFIVIGAVVTLNGLLWYNPTSPATKASEARDAHLFFEGNRLLSYSHESDFNADVIYDNGVDTKYSNIGMTSKKAIKLDIPLNVDKIEIKIKETKEKDGTTLKSFDKVYKRKADNPNIFVVSGGHISVKNTANAKPELYRDISDAVGNLKTASDENKFISAVFLKRTSLEIVQALGDKVSNATLEIDKDSYTKDGYDTYFDNHSKEGDTHQLFWDVTAKKNFKGQDASLKVIEPHVLSRVVKFNYKDASGDYEVLLIKSENGNDPTLGVKYGLLLSTDGYSFAGKSIDGKSWIADYGYSAAPAHDTLGLYTVVVKSGTADAKDVATKIATEIGGVN